MDALDMVQQELAAQLAHAPRTTAVDISEVRHLSTTTVAALVWIKRRCTDRGVDVVLREPTRHSVDTLRRTGLLGLLPVEQARPASLPRPGRAPMEPEL
jgi:anti-anti-sigma regulatory factor